MPRETDSTTKFKADISQLKAAMQEASRAVRLASSEFKAATAGMDDWSKTADGLSAKTKQLNSTLEAQKKQLRSLEEQYRLTVQEQGENSKGAQELAIKINNQKAAIKNTEASLNSYEKALNEVENANEDAAESAQKASDGFTVMKGALANLVADGIRAAVSGLKDFARQAFEAGANFESAMSKVGAVSGANAEEIEKLTAKAKEMGEKTVFSASQSAEAFNYMAMAGWKTEDMLGGIEGIMNLAAASGADLATTSDIVTDALTAFGKSADDAGQLADIMAAASSNANTNVEMMGETFKYVAPVAGALGYSMEDTAVAIGLMANAGIKASQGGTALRSIINRLVAPTKESGTAMDRLGLSITDSEGNMKSLAQIMQDLRQSLRGLNKDEQASIAKHLAGQEAMSGLLAIVNASELDFLKLTNAIDNSSGAAQDMANTMNDNVSGQLTLLNSQIEGVMIKQFDRASASMRKGINSVSEAIASVNWDEVGDAVGYFSEKAANLFSFILSNGGSIIGILTTIGSVSATLFAVNKIGAFIGWLNSLMRTYTSLNAVITTVKTSQLALNAAQLASPVGLVVAGLGALAAAFIVAGQRMKENAEEAYGLTDAEKELNREIKNNYESQKQLNEQRDDSVKATTGEFNYIKRLKDEYNGLIDKNGEVKKGYEDRAEFIKSQLADALGIEYTKVQELIDANGKLGESIDELITKKQAEATLSAYDDSYKKAKSGEREALDNVIAAQNNYTKSQEAVTKAQADADAALKALNAEYDKYGRDAHAYSTALAEANTALAAAKKSHQENTAALKEANAAYSEGQTTIKNYEGLSSAIISGETSKINTELTKLTQGFKDASSATEQELKSQVQDFEQYYVDIKAAMDAGNPVITQDMVDNAELMMNRAKAEFEKGVPYFEESGKSATSAYIKGLKINNAGVKNAAEDTVKQAKKGADNQSNGFSKTGKNVGLVLIKGINSKDGDAQQSGSKLVKSAKRGADNNVNSLKKSGETAGSNFNKGVASKSTESANSAKKLTASANKALSSNSAKKEASKSGENFGLGFAKGITSNSVFAAIANAIKKLVQNALSKLKKEQKEGSPSKLTAISGNFFGLGYAKGMTQSENEVAKAAGNLVKVASYALLSNDSYAAGQSFMSSFLKGIVTLQGGVVKTAQASIQSVLAQLLSLNNFNFSEVQQNASNLFSKVLQKKIQYTTDRINYENEKKIEELDKNIEQLQNDQENALERMTELSEKKQESLEKEIEQLEAKKATKKNKKRIKELKEQLEAEKKNLKEQTELLQNNYKKLIEEQQKQKQGYQEASQKMLQEFNTAMSEYQTAAQQLIDSTMSGVVSKYQTAYNELINKQDTLINKLKSTGDLFNLSGANVMTVNDLRLQTEQITRYANKLKDIKSKVSSDLFDEIASYDVKEGEAFIDRLLAMSKEELEAYNNAYTQKMEAAEALSESIYDEDFDKLEKDYKKEIKKAFSGIEKELQDLGEQSMKGFLEGLTGNTDYVRGTVKEFLNGMIETFRQELGIHSPSKVTMKLGEFTGEGFVNGLKDMINTVKKTAQQIVDTVTDTLDFGDMGAVKSIASVSTSNGVSRQNEANNAPTTQVINFNQTNNSPKALDRLTIYRQTNNLLFGAKVRLNDV